MLHDDVVGEEITEEEEYNVKAYIVMAVTGREFEEGMDLRFPGSQPVSLARSNIDMLNFKRYWVTWKVIFSYNIACYFRSSLGCTRSTAMVWLHVLLA